MAGLKDFFDVQIRQQQKAAAAEYKRVKAIKMMMMGISDTVKKVFIDKAEKSKNHIKMMQQGY